MALDFFRASPLPNPSGEYDPQYVRQLIRIIELYFSQLDSNTPNHAQKYTADMFVGGTFSGDGTAVKVPYGQFTSSVTQTATSIANANTLALDLSSFLASGITLTTGSHIVVPVEGVYTITYSLQVWNTVNGTEAIDVWLRQNGVDVPETNSNFGIPPRKSTIIPSSVIAVTPIMLTLAANDYLEVVWRVTDLGVNIKYLPAVTASGTTPAIPATPSAIVQVQFVSDV